MKKIAYLTTIIALFGICSCATKKTDINDMTAEQLYNQAYDYLEQTSYTKSAEIFEKLELEHPYSRWATKSKLMAAYAYYRDKKYDDAIIALDRFIKYHPGNKDIAYAYYLKGLCAYEQMPIADKAQDNTQEALATFSQLIVRFPDSIYAQDAKEKVNISIENMAAHEMEVGRFYLKKNNYLSALNRFNEVIKKYAHTSQAEEALYRQVEIYTILGMNAEAKDSAEILSKEYPDSKWVIGTKSLIE